MLSFLAHRIIGLIIYYIKRVNLCNTLLMNDMNSLHQKHAIFCRQTTVPYVIRKDKEHKRKPRLVNNLYSNNYGKMTKSDIT